MARDDPQMKLRLTEGLKDRVTDAARKNNRSINAEIVSRLERYDSLGGEVDAMWEVARALSAEIDEACGYDKSSGPLLDLINDAFEAVDDAGAVDRAKLSRVYSEAARSRLSGALSGLINLPAGLRDRIQAKAQIRGNTVEAEILETLDREYPAPADVMHIHIDNIRRALDLYEKEKDPRTRLYWQALVEGMVTGGENLEMNWDAEPGGGEE